MFSALDVVLFAPKLFFSLLVRIADSCFNVGKSAYACLSDCVGLAFSPFYQVWRYCYHVAVGAVRPFAQSSSKKRCCLPSFKTAPVVSLADTIDYVLQSVKEVPSRLKTGLSCSISDNLCCMLQPWLLTPTLWAQLFSKRISWYRKLPSKARSSLIKAGASISKGSVQFLWSYCFVICTTVHAWLIVLLSGPVTESSLDTQVLLLPCSRTSACST